jgi:hypothetical protein
MSTLVRAAAAAKREERRFELVKTVLSGLLASGRRTEDSRRRELIASDAVALADAVLEAMERSKPEGMP